jgi:peptidoglycan/xylan/chitin deacetylase (PgdA/CDA1 family)
MFRAQTYINRLTDDNIAIFLFHGVVQEQSSGLRNYNKKHILESQFEDLLAGLVADGHPVSMNDVVEFCEGELLPPKSFAITFDDGFLNNFEVAAPILERYEIPATFYVTSDFVDRNRMSWADRIDQAFDSVLEISIYVPWRNKRTHAKTKDEKISLLEEIREVVKGDSNYDGDELASLIQTQLGFDEIWNGNGVFDKKMTWNQLRILDNKSLFNVGGHSHTHPVLSHLDENQLRYEISTCINMIGQELDRSIEHFSYPEGMSSSYSSGVINELKKFNIICSPSAEDGVNSVSSDPFKLKRIFVV